MERGQNKNSKFGGKKIGRRNVKCKVCKNTELFIANDSISGICHHCTEIDSFRRAKEILEKEGVEKLIEKLKKAKFEGLKSDYRFKRLTDKELRRITKDL